uniref:Aminopeptidase n=1 Tax=Trichobilharzia regenti TaxID=157069 RepID=A0AA85K350_TRIRE|nr:unnamed protein product [Trichobilharzia regenti]
MSLKVLLTTVYLVFVFLCNNQVASTGIHSLRYYGYNTPMEVERRYDADLFLKGTETSPNNITGVTTNEAVNKSSKNIRLPQTVFPRFYDLQLQVHIHGNADTKDSYFNGSVTIEIQCLAATAELFIHAYPNLNVSRDQIKIFSDDKEDSKKTEIPIQTISYDKDAEWYHIQLKDALQPNASYKLIFGQFNSSLNYEPVGFYLSRYAENGTYKYLASTQFESTYARRVFPCWDEPGFKAVFQVTIIRHKDFYTLSNMPVNNTVALHADWRQDQFQPSVKMSSYLLAFVICQFHGLRVVDSKGRNFTVWARPEKIESARYALDIGRRILTFFEDYFGVPYPLPKMDLIAIPNFTSGAMENWGLITFGESALLWDPYTGSAALKEWVTTVIIHELSHQWFGNLVTMKWWNNLWLNEGFASFFEYTGTDFVQPHWKYDEQFIFNDLQRAMISDASIESHPVINSANSPDEIEDIFDTITYSKGASLIRMMKSFLGDDVFLNGLKIYLQENKYKNTDAEDLWKALDRAVKSVNKDIDIKSIMDTWTKQMNYPILIVNRSDSNTFDFKQIHFYESSNDTLSPSPYNFTWKIPITYTTKDGSANEIIWMNNATLKMELNVMPNDWYIINIGQTGYYRVHYVDNNWELLIDELLKNYRSIPDSARPQIIGDLFHLANHGNVSFTTFLNLTKYLSQETQYVPWTTAGRALLYLDRMLLLDENYGDYQAYVRLLVNAAVRDVDWITMREDRNEEKHLLRGTLGEIACHVEHELCLLTARVLFTLWMSEPVTNPIPPGLRSVVYCTAIRFGGQAEWKFLRSQYNVNETEDVEKENILTGLSCSRDIWTMKLYFDWIKQDKQYWSAIPEFAVSPIGNRMLWDYVHEAVKSLKTGMENSTRSPTDIDEFTKEVIQRLSNPYYSLNNRNDGEKILRTEADWLQLPQNHTLKGELKNLLTTSKRNLKWLDTHLQTIVQWLKENVPRTAQEV